jgi:multiple sugar transport system substrate-binding protein
MSHTPRTHRARRRTAATAIGLTCVSALVAGCSSGSPSTSSAQTAASGPVTVQYWGWVPGIENAIAIWNKSNPNIHVDFSRIASNQATTKYQTAVQAGNAPCLGQVGYDSMLSYVADGLLQDVTNEAQQYQKNYLPWTWGQVSAAGRTFGLPQDTGPLVMYYRTDLFAKYGINVPGTWTGYAAAAQKVHAADPSVVLGTLSPDDAGMFQALAWQNHANWWSTDGNSWVPGINSAPTKAVASYWQQLISSGDVKIANRWDPTFYQDMQNGKVLSYIGAAWNASLIAQNVASGAGKWRVAQMPVYSTSQPATANSGGSAVAVLKGCKDTAAALKFANWLDTAEASMDILASPTGGGLYPASTAALDYPVVNQGVSYFGGQNIYAQFKQSATEVNHDWNWGPVQTQVYTAVGNALSDVALKKATLPDALATVQSTAVAALKQKGISVKEG